MRPRGRRALAWTLGWRALTARGPQAVSKFLISSSLAMALGLVPLVLVLSVADGMIEGISLRTIETSLYHVQAWPLTAEAAAGADRASLEARLRSVPGFRSLWPEQDGFALAYAPGGARLGVSIRGIDPSWPGADPGAARYLAARAGQLTLGDHQVWLGAEAAAKLGVKPGDPLKLLTTRGRGSLTLPRVTTVTVAALVGVGYQELDRLWVFAPLDLTSSLLDPEEDPLWWGIKADGPLDRTPEVTQAVRQALGDQWQAISWQTSGRSQFLNYQATRTLLAVVMALVLVVAAVNVSTAMVTTGAERRRETAILKALGADDRLIRGQFLVLGLGAGVLGTAAGLGLGMAAALCLNPAVQVLDALVTWTTGGGFHVLDRAYYLESIPVKFDPGALALAALGSLGLSVLASWWPSRRAARERPLDTLRRV